ncbi:hypothetical protein [Candidatus Accumulibacter sp. ACC012]|jgi:hypothetical protein|uniref:hypothetical protein n=1 Tax=Candidatus Accumulibacter sp. ACC012 TaxID=2823332 RepID=UPI0025B85959|nr:hypothetical protein [Candidatus Accumulibacter sp. ACC012]
MNRYDPDQPPNSEEWLALDEQLRIGLVEKYHRQERVQLPNVTVHAALHAIVENQLAENLEPAARAMARLTTEGLDRHEAVHAIASVVAEHIHDLLNAKADANSSKAVYAAAVERLNAATWRARG